MKCRTEDLIRAKFRIVVGTTANGIQNFVAFKIVEVRQTIATGDVQKGQFRPLLSPIPQSQSDVAIPLIPVLDEAEACKKIIDSDLREKCRQLNTYRGAFVHVDTYEPLGLLPPVRNAIESCLAW